MKGHAVEFCILAAVVGAAVSWGGIVAMKPMILALGYMVSGSACLIGLSLARGKDHD
jgi:hypothetical protein